MKMCHSFIRMPSYYGTPEEDVELLVAEAEKITGKSCPFCGGEARVQLNWIYTNDPVVSIKCDSCGCQTSRFAVGKMANGNEYTIIDRLYQALNKWNERV